MNLKNVTLELSSKPFYDDTPEMMERVCRTMFRQWRNLTDTADQVSVLLWIADGSEILEYTGDLSQTFEWAYWCGCANPIPPTGNETERQKIDTHRFPKKYREDVGPRTYAWLKQLIATVKRVGGEMLAKPIRVGAIFDNGPEFAVSNFKYKKHSEIAQADTLYKGSFVTCNSTLHRDLQPYAAFPGGIPEGISLGEFLGAQFEVFAQDMGYDYIWLSNGMGFGTETWGIKGALFDKTDFYPEKADEAAETMLQFWRDFTSHWPADKIETRGSNFSAGAELSTDAAPLKELYTEFKVAPPVNSPWAALNFNSGLELAAWMSHVAVLPGDHFPYRFYPHDPWFMNSPWLDRYGREPWDIYQPLSMCRIDENGQVKTPNSVSFLTVDDTLGRMPDQVPDEVIPHIKEALRHAPDQAGPLVWVYPFFEYSEMVRGENRRPDVVFNEDMFLGEAIQQGLPLNTVISTDNFRALMTQGSGLFEASVIVAPVSAYASVEHFIMRGGQVIFYGSLDDAPKGLLDALGVNNASAVTGEVIVECPEDNDCVLQGAAANASYVHSQFSAGGLTEVLAGNDASVNVLASASPGDCSETRLVAMTRRLSEAQTLGFVRSLLPSPSEVNERSRNFDNAGKDVAFPVEKLMRRVLATFGWDIRYQTHGVCDTYPRICVSRNDNAFYFSIFAPSTGVKVEVSTPYGAPILTEQETVVSGGRSQWHPGKSWHKECRCFIRQEEEGVVGSKIQCPSYPEYHDRRSYHNLKNAEVTFFPPQEYLDTVEVVCTPEPVGPAEILSYEPLPVVKRQCGQGTSLTFTGASGSLYFVW